MRIDSLSIRNFRGIRDLKLTLGGESAAILGPNGTGKSSVVDAIDFLMRGGVRRLEGEGAGELSVTKHAPLIGTAVDDSWVEAVLLPAVGDPVTVRRTVANPEDLSHAEPLPEDVIQAMRLAGEGGHHLLTRRELLRFVFTEPGNRARAVGALLHLDGVEASRKEIQGAARDASDKYVVARGKFSALAASAQNSFNPPLRPNETVTDRVNALRAVLDGTPVTDVNPVEMLEGLTPPTVAAVHPLQSARNQTLLRAFVTETLQNLQERGQEAISAYASDAALFRRDATLQMALRSGDLVERGTQLLDADRCPLCLTPQGQHELRALFAQRATESRAARELRDALDKRRTELLSDVGAGLQRTADVRAAIALRDDLPVAGIDKLHAALSLVTSDVLLPLDEETIPHGEVIARVQDALVEASADIAALRAILQSLPATSVLQSSWDQLSQYSKAVSEERAAAMALAVAEQAAAFLRSADECFLRARDEVLQGTYDAVAARMADVYRLMHGPDESAFAAEMEPTRAGLRLSVDFLGQGRFPPSALHSEGHQDSMGLCFFLALSSHLAGAGLPFVVLDDVVTTVDYGHRRGVANVLKSKFSDRQLILTTHDRLWWRQLRSSALIGPKNAIEFVGWTLEEGPKTVQTSGESIQAARAALARGSAPEAAHALRRAVEEVFPDVCDALGASVRYRADGANDAGEFLQAAVSRMKYLVGKARTAAQEWKTDDAAITSFAERRTAACAAFDGEQWLVNPTLHFNQWTANITVADLEPVVTAYEELFALYSCNNCKGTLFCVENGRTPSMLRCPCAKVAWALEPPPKKQ